MRTVSFLLLMGYAFVASAQQDAQVRELPYFNKLRITNEVKVYITRGDNQFARVVVSGLEPDNLVIDVIGKTLMISFKGGVFKNVSAEVYLTCQDLRDIYVSNFGRVSLQNELVGDTVVMNAHNGAQIDAELNLKYLNIKATKGAVIRLKGQVGSYKATISSGATLSALELNADSVSVKATTKAIAKVAAKEVLDAKIRSGATLTILGEPANKNIKKRSGATILEQ
jgi:hypothetical protein